MMFLTSLPSFKEEVKKTIIIKKDYLTNIFIIIDGRKKPDKLVRTYMFLTGFALLFPFKYFKTKAFYRNLLSVRWEMYSVRDGLYYKHFKTGQNNSRAY